MHFLDKLHKKFKKESREENDLTHPPQTTFTMKKPFGGLKMAGFAGAFGHCRTDEDKVKLLSVLTNTNYTDDEETASTGSAVDILSSSSSSTADHRRNAVDDDERTPPDVCPIEITNDCYVADDVPPSHSSNLIPNENVDDLTNNNANNNNIGDGRPKDDCEKLRRHCKKISTPSANVGDETKIAAQQQEWTFTLYDFDAKGTVTKEDILSLVRSIYEVLASAKIPIVRGCHDSSTGRAVGAFKIKLAVVNDTADPNNIATTSTTEYSNNKNDRRKKILSFVNNNNKKASNRKTTTIAVDEEINDDDEVEDNNNNVVDDDDDDDNGDDDVEAVAATMNECSFDVNRFYEEIPLIRRATVKKATKRHHDNGKQSTSPIPYGKLHRQNGGGGAESLENFDTSSPPGKQCTLNCTYRDYVNLSEVENCCSGGGGNHQSSCVNKCIHHIRHCDRHCHCPPTSFVRFFDVRQQQLNNNSSKLLHNLLFSPHTSCNDPCLTTMENEYEKNLHKKLIVVPPPPPQVQHCCKNNKTSFLETTQHHHNHNHYHNNSTSALPLNERARAYYSQQKQHATTKQSNSNNNSNNPKNRNNETTVDYVELKHLTATQQQNLKPETMAKLSLHQRKHRNREMDKIRAMQQVREWILNEVDVGGGGGVNDDFTPFHDENNIVDTEKLSPRKWHDISNNTNNNASKLIEQRGEADGGCGRMLVEHKHFHEHHHFHHF